MKLTKIYEGRSTIRMYNADCLKAMSDIKEKSIDVILTDPPYGTTACSWDTIIPFELMWDEINRVIKDNGAILIFGSEPFSSLLRTSNIKNYRYDWIWHKNTGGGFALAKKQPMKRHEIISVFYKKQPVYNPIYEEYSASTKKRFKDGEKVNRSSQMDKSTNKIHGGLSLEGEQGIMINRGKYPTSVKYFKSPNNSNGQRHHPTQKPVKLLEYLIKTYSNKKDTVLDFTMGSGSTLIACHNLKRNCIGIEVDTDYFNDAVKRFEQHISQTQLF